MKRFFFFFLIAVVLFTTSSAGVIVPEPRSPLPTAEERENPSSRNSKARYQLSRKELRNMSTNDMARILGREMSEKEKADFRTNRKKFVKDSGMADVKQTNTMAIIGFVTSLILPPLGIIFGIIALGQIKKSGENGKGWAIAGIAVGAVFTLYLILMVSALGAWAA